jgi:hypothetical protein
MAAALCVTLALYYALPRSPSAIDELRLPPSAKHVRLRELWPSDDLDYCVALVRFQVDEATFLHWVHQRGLDVASRTGPYKGLCVPEETPTVQFKEAWWRPAGRSAKHHYSGPWNSSGTISVEWQDGIVHIYIERLGAATPGP